MLPEMLAVLSERPRVLTTSGSVGQGGDNRPDDVRLIQNLLNVVPASEGGPATKLAVDGLVGPKTVAAISRYQSNHLGFSDGRVDARNKTIRHLVEFVLTKQPLPDQPGLTTPKPNEVNAIRSFISQPFPPVRASGAVSTRGVAGASALVGGNPGFGAPFTASGWTINNNAFSVDVAVKDTGVYVAKMEIFQDANPSVRANLAILGGFKAISPKRSLPLSVDIALPSFNSTQGKIIRGLMGFNPISPFSFIGLVQFGFIGASLGPGGGAVNVFQFGWVPAPPLPGNCIGFAVMVGEQKGIPGVSLGGGTGICSVV